MAMIRLTTIIDAPVDVCFDLSRSIDLHINSMSHTSEHAIAGRTTGFIGLGESVTWESRHFFIKMRMTVRISELKLNEYFIDEIVKGPFKLLRHLHEFEAKGTKTTMTDEFIFRSPFGWLGKMVDKYLLTGYMQKLLIKRNEVIKAAAEELVQDGFAVA